MTPTDTRQSHRSMNIGLCVIATGKYICFVSDLWESARSFFLTSQTVNLFLFTDHVSNLPADCKLCPTEHRPWPGPTLYRYHFMLSYQQQLERMDYLFYCDADMRFVGPVGDEILGELVAVHHPCSYARPRPGCPYFTAHLGSPSDQFGCPCGRHYYAGAFQGGRTARYLEAMSVLRDRIDDDDRKGVMAEWHDETHWNEHLRKFRPDIELSPSYCYPEWQTVPFEPRLLALEKAEEDLRS